MSNYFLHLDTATTVCSVALSLNGQIVATKHTNDGYRHAELLTPFILDIFDQAGIVARDLKAISLNVGPGSYTGLRIGAGVAKGLAYSLSIPIMGINSMHALYLIALRNNSSSFDYYIPMLDARRNEVYCAVYDNCGVKVQDSKPAVIDSNSFAEFLNTSSCCFIGNANQKVSKLITHPNAVYFDAELSSEIQVEWAWDKFLKKEFLNSAYFEPHYLKAFGEK